MADPLFEITDVSLNRAFVEYARQRELRGKGVLDTAQKFMRMWVDAALALVPAGDRGKVEAYLLRQTAGIRNLTSPAKDTKKAKRENALGNKYRGTVAARIVAALDIYGVRGKDSATFYRGVNRWVQRRKFAVNLHRAGMLPARKALRIRDPKGNPPRLKSAPGSYQESLTEDIVTLTVENWASSQKTKTNQNPKGITGLAGRAFESSLPTVYARLEEFIIADLNRAGRRVGFSP